jgi:hypothetical protein
MARKKSQATPEVETRRFEDIIAERTPARKSTRELLADAVAARAESRAKIEAQAEQQAKRKARNDRILAKYHGLRTGDFYREIAEADRRERS